VTVRWNGCTMTSSTCRTNPQHNETIDVFYIKKSTLTLCFDFLFYFYLLHFSF